MTEAAAGDGNAHPHRRAQAGRRLDHGDDRARPRGDQARREGRGRIPRRRGQLASTMRGNMVPADIYDMAVKERDAFRKSKGR